MRKLFCTAVVIFAICLETSAEKGREAGNHSKKPLNVTIDRILVQPSPLLFSSPEEGRKVLVTGITESGEKIDLTSLAEYKSLDQALRVEQDGFLYPTRAGRARLLISAANRSVELPATIKNREKARQMTFVRDVLPAINKIGCTAGTCHGAAKGKNGFKLSLRGYDPEFDYQSLLLICRGDASTEPTRLKA